MTKRKVWTAYGVMGIGGSLIGLLLLPTLPLLAAIYCIGKLTDRLLKRLESH